MVTINILLETFMSTNIKNIESSDIVLASYLKCLGYQLDRIDKQGNRGIFCFRDVPDDVLSKFDLGKALVDPIAFNGAIKSLTTATRRIS